MRKNHQLSCTLLSFFFLPTLAFAQPCTPQGDQVSYGTNNVWIGYVYDNMDFTNYLGYINEGNVSSPNFSQNFGGSTVNFPTNGCPLYTEGFTVRYKLTKTFSAGIYEFMVAGDDGIRFSIDGGATWLIDNWVYNGYQPTTASVSLNGTYNMVIEYLEGAFQNRVFFSVSQSCTATGNTSIYGSGVVWNGYFYSGINFNEYKGMVAETTGANLAFSQNFGGASVQYPTSDCPVTTDFFSVRYRIRHTFPSNSYTLTVAGDDKYRLSLDGGLTWVIDRWGYGSSNTTRMYTSNLSGTYDMVLEYFDNDGSNFLQFSSINNILLPLNLYSFTGEKTGQTALLRWSIDEGDELLSFDVERSDDGVSYQPVGVIAASTGRYAYTFTDIFNSAEVVYYRIKIKNQQGNIAYSKVISLSGNLNGIRIYPTLISSNNLNLSTDRALPNAVLTINDMLGRQLIHRPLGNLARGQIISLYLNERKLQQGIYLVQLSSDRQPVKTERIILQ